MNRRARVGKNGLTRFRQAPALDAGQLGLRHHHGRWQNSRVPQTQTRLVLSPRLSRPLALVADRGACQEPAQAPGLGHRPPDPARRDGPGYRGI